MFHPDSPVEKLSTKTCYFSIASGFILLDAVKNLDIRKNCDIKQIFLGRIAKKSFPSVCIKREIKKKSEIEGAFRLFEGLALDGMGIDHGCPHIAVSQ